MSKKHNYRALDNIQSLVDDYDAPMRGYLEINIFKGNPRTGKLVRTYKDPNLVVNKARELMAILVAQVNANKIITNMRWGTGGHVILTPTVAIPPTAGDTALAIPLVSPASKPITILFPTITSVKFTATLEQTEANGQGLSEEGLFTNDNSMFARKTFGMLTKTSSFSITFSHVLLF